MEGKYTYVPRQGYCHPCKVQQLHLAFRCSTCDTKLLFTDVLPDAIDLLPALLRRLLPRVQETPQEIPRPEEEKEEEQQAEVKDKAKEPLESLQAQQVQSKPESGSKSSLRYRSPLKKSPG